MNVHGKIIDSLRPTTSNEENNGLILERNDPEQVFWLLSLSLHVLKVRGVGDKGLQYFRSKYSWELVDAGKVRAKHNGIFRIIPMHCRSLCILW